jgi:triacylglycerol lipase
MPSAPRGSRPMYFPAAPFALADAVACAALVDVAYNQCTQWYNQRFPSKANFVWTKPNNGYVYSAPLFWTNTWLGTSYDEPFGFVAADTNFNAYLVFRGTVSDADDYQDALVDQTPYQIVPGYGQVHLGFYQIYQKLTAQVQGAIAAVNRTNPFKRFFFTGHSLGSGLSSLAVPDIITNTPIKPAQLTVLHHNLASPRVGDSEFADTMNSNGVATYRIVNTEDLVPDAPSAIFGSYLYKHIGTPVDFTAQYNSIDDNHSLDIAYDYALANPANPEGPLPPARPLGLARRPGVRMALDGQLIRLTRPPPGIAAPPA